MLVWQRQMLIAREEGKGELLQRLVDLDFFAKWGGRLALMNVSGLVACMVRPSAAAAGHGDRVGRDRCTYSNFNVQQQKSPGL